LLTFLNAEGFGRCNVIHDSGPLNLTGEYVLAAVFAIGGRPVSMRGFLHAFSSVVHETKINAELPLRIRILCKEET
jgi:hypothetical protein